MSESVNKAVNEFARVVIEKSKFRDQAREHAYRPALEQLFKALLPGYSVFNDPARSEFGNPDFAILLNSTPRCYAETKDVTVSLDKIAKSEQLDRYLGYPNLILTNNLEFRFYRHGSLYGEPIELIKEQSDGTYLINEDRCEELGNKVQAFVDLPSITVKRAGHLAGIMGKSAQRIRSNVLRYLESENDQSAELTKQFETFRDLLIKDLTKDDFADMYAQTLVYGLFAARYNDDSLDTFTRREARDLVPKANPFLRKFFDHIAGESFDYRLEIIVDELCDVFMHSNVHDLMHEYYRSKNLFGGEEQSPDPVIHFYEDFLREYDTQKKIDLGVFYTPPAVVSFIVRSVDEILKEKFDIKEGLASTEKTSQLMKTQEISKDSGDTQKRYTDLHRVQILDPAVGTGTFLNEVVRTIRKRFDGQEGSWSPYVDEHLLPRLYGFELMMASYTIAHLKLGITFKETGYNDFNQRLRIYLTNSLEEPRTFEETNTLFGVLDALTTEAKEASAVKRDAPIMVVIGNPPYSGESSNTFYSENDVYKVEPGGKQKLQERNSKWINDDYVKFIRFAESQIEQTGEGVLAMITAHGYIDNPTFRGMRWHLMQTFDEIYILDLHGNTNKKEKTPEGGTDQNVFDIRTGVSIILGVKKNNSPTGSAKVFHSDLYGKQKEKYSHLVENTWSSIEWEEVFPEKSPVYSFATFPYEAYEDYSEGILLNELFPVNSVGIVTSRDAFVIDSKKDDLEKRIKTFLSYEDAKQAKTDFNLRENKRWKIKDVLNSLYDSNSIHPICYRPFDNRFIYYDNNFIERAREDVMKYLQNGNNIGLEFCRQTISNKWQHIFLTSRMVDDSYISNKSRERGYVAPLYIKEEGEGRLLADVHPNFDGKLIKKIETLLSMSLDWNANIDKSYLEEREKTFAPIDLFDYIYAVLHSQNYRDTYEEFLKSNFPRIPFNLDKESFWKLVLLGSNLRSLHLLNSLKFNEFVTTFSKSGSNIIENKYPIYQDEKVYINESQYFGGIPLQAWDSCIGGYQPAQKWLKDRRGQQLSSDDINHYQKIIVALSETDRIMKEIDEIYST